MRVKTKVPPFMIEDLEKELERSVVESTSSLHGVVLAIPSAKECVIESFLTSQCEKSVHKKFNSIFNCASSATRCYFNVCPSVKGVYLYRKVNKKRCPIVFYINPKNKILELLSNINAMRVDMYLVRHRIKCKNQISMTRVFDSIRRYAYFKNLNIDKTSIVENVSGDFILDSDSIMRFKVIDSTDFVLKDSRFHIKEKIKKENDQVSYFVDILEWRYGGRSKRNVSISDFIKNVDMNNLTNSNIVFKKIRDVYDTVNIKVGANNNLMRKVINLKKVYGGKRIADMLVDATDEVSFLGKFIK